MKGDTLEDFDKEDDYFGSGKRYQQICFCFLCPTEYVQLKKKWDIPCLCPALLNTSTWPLERCPYFIEFWILTPLTAWKTKNEIHTYISPCSLDGVGWGAYKPTCIGCSSLWMLANMIYLNMPRYIALQLWLVITFFHQCNAFITTRISQSMLFNDNLRP